MSLHFRKKLMSRALKVFAEIFKCDAEDEDEDEDDAEDEATDSWRKTKYDGVVH